MSGDIIIGNACSLGAMVTDSISGTRKKHGEIMALQILSQIFYTVGSIVLRGYSSTAQNLVAILRNLAAMKNIGNRALEWFLIALGVVLGVLWNNRGLMGWLPIVANLEYSVAVFRFRENARALKLAFLACVLMYGAFNLSIANYVGVAANAVIATTTGLSLIRGGKTRH